MVKVRFRETRMVRDGSGTTYQAGSVYELSRGSADHWIKRGVASEVRPQARQSEPVTANSLGQVIDDPNEAKREADMKAKEKAKRDQERAEAKAKREQEAADETIEDARQDVEDVEPEVEAPEPARTTRRVGRPPKVR